MNQIQSAVTTFARRRTNCHYAGQIISIIIGDHAEDGENCLDVTVLDFVRPLRVHRRTQEEEEEEEKNVSFCHLFMKKTKPFPGA